MRRFGTLATLTMLGLLVGCGGGSDGKGTDGGGPGGTSGTGRDLLTGQCLGASDEVCTGEDAYVTCLAGRCDAQLKACYGADYAKGKYAGPCGDLMNCEMKCPCDATKDACEATCYSQNGNSVTACLSCTTTAATCITGSGCAEPVCTPTSTTTTTLTSTSTATGTGCAAALACCQSLAASLGATAVQQCQAAVAGQTDAACAQAIATYKSLGVCP
jgi:hypothetical protein